MNNEHILEFYCRMVLVYTEASVVGIATAHVVEFYFERWWNASIESYRVDAIRTA